jgi:ATP-dependent protease ClpP protease subunit
MPFIELVAQRRSPGPPAGLQPPENAQDWYRIDNAVEDEDTTDVHVYSSIGGWFGMYADEFIEDIKQITTSKMNIRLNSPGGSVFEGIAIANAIRNHPATVTVYVDSLAASIASVIAMAGDRLVMMPQSQIMVHNASGACYGDASEMTKMADLLDKQSLNIAQAYAEHSGRPLAEWQQYMDAETWFTAEEAVAVGLADEAMPMKPKKTEDADDAVLATTAAARTWDLSMYHYAGREKAPAPRITVPAAPFTAGGILTASMLRGLKKPVVNGVLRQFDEGDRVAAIVKHEPEHDQGTIAVVNGNAYGVIWDKPDDDTVENDTDVYRWYTDDELQWLGGGEDHDPDEAKNSEPTRETVKPGISHPKGVPLPPHAAADPVVVFNGYSSDLVRMIQDAIRAELVVEGTACPSHSTAVKDGTWDAGANEGHLPSPVPLTDVKKTYAYYDESQVADGAVPKSAAKLPHHFVSADGTPGAASINGVRNALARLPQTKGLSDEERSAAEAHLRKHLDAYSGDSEDEDHVHEEIDDASKTSPPPDENEPDTDEDPDAEPDEDEDEPDDKAKAPVDEWAGVVSSLTTPSPSADDVFNSLKEAW